VWRRQSSQGASDGVAFVRSSSQPAVSLSLHSPWAHTTHGPRPRPHLTLFSHPSSFSLYSPVCALQALLVPCRLHFAVACPMRLEARTVAPPSLDAVKMEDRKRPSGHDDAAPPAKRQAVTANGARPHPDADMPWKDDIEVRPPIRSRLRCLAVLCSHALTLPRHRPTRRMPSCARCANTSAKRPPLSLSSTKWSPAQSTMTTISAQ
jgi:hypothetical protein